MTTQIKIGRIRARTKKISSRVKIVAEQGGYSRSLEPF